MATLLDVIADLAALTVKVGVLESTNAAQEAKIAALEAAALQHANDHKAAGWDFRRWMVNR